MIISYETYRIHSALFEGEGTLHFSLIFTPPLRTSASGLNRLILTATHRSVRPPHLRRGSSAQERPDVDGAGARQVEVSIWRTSRRYSNGFARLTARMNVRRCPRRILLSGTPMQNDLEEFYAMVGLGESWTLLTIIWGLS